MYLFTFAIWGGLLLLERGLAVCVRPSSRRLVLVVHTYNLVLILTRHTLARAGLANRLLDRHEVVTIDGDVDTLGQATP